MEQGAGGARVALTLSGVRVNALVDSGASCSVLHLDTLRKIARARHRNITLEKAEDVPGVTGHKLKILGRTQIQVDRVGPIEVMVAEKMSHQLILGNDSLRVGGAIHQRAYRTPLSK